MKEVRFFGLKQDLFAERIRPMPALFGSTVVTIYAVSLKFNSAVDDQEPIEPLRELAIHLVFADDEAQARAKGKEIGRGLETTYHNVNNNEVRVIFEGVVQVQDLAGDRLFDGMEVSYWLYSGNRVNIDDNWIDPPYL